MLYDYDVLFARVNGICAVTWKKKEWKVSWAYVIGLPQFVHVYRQASEYYVNRTHIFCLIHFKCKNKV